MFRRMASASIGMAAMSLATVPVQAQYMMHLDPNLYMLMAMQMSGGVNTCITGMALSDKKVEEARQPTLDAMKGYFAAAQSGAPKSASFRVSKRQSGPLAPPSPRSPRLMRRVIRWRRPRTGLIQIRCAFSVRAMARRRKASGW